MMKMLKFLHTNRLRGRISKRIKFQFLDFHLVESAVLDTVLSNLVSQDLLHQKQWVLIWVQLVKLNKNHNKTKD